jgi:hypothetical protein
LKGSNNGSSDFLHQPRYVYPWSTSSHFLGI